MLNKVHFVISRSWKMTWNTASEQTKIGPFVAREEGGSFYRFIVGWRQDFEILSVIKIHFFLLCTVGKFLRYRRQVYRIKKRQVFTIVDRGRRRTIRGIQRRIRLTWRRKTQRVTLRGRRIMAKIGGRVRIIKPRGRSLLYRRGRRGWKLLRGARLWFTYAGKRRTLFGRYGRLSFKLYKRWAKLIARRVRYIRYRRKSLVIRRQGRGFSVKGRNGKWSRTKRVQRNRRRRGKNELTWEKCPREMTKALWPVCLRQDKFRFATQSIWRVDHQRCFT